MDTTCFVFLDETGTTTNLTRRYGRCPRGERLVSATPWGLNRAGFAGGCLVWLLRGHRDGLKLRVVACFGFGRWHVADGLE
jgi:hypothetical protein